MHLKCVVAYLNGVGVRSCVLSCQTCKPQALGAYGALAASPFALAIPHCVRAAQVEFIRVLDCEDHIVEYNQEACRVVSFNGGKKSLIRSFPSKLF